LLFCAVAVIARLGQAQEHAPNQWLGPCAEVLSSDGRTLYVVCQKASAVAAVDTVGRRVVRFFDVPGSPNGIALAPGSGKVLVTCSGEANRIVLPDRQTGRIWDSWRGGAGVCCPVPLQNAQGMLVCNRYEGTVSRIDISSGKELGYGGVQREPVAAAVCADGSKVAVANLVPVGPANATVIRAAVTLLDLPDLKRRRNVWLPNGGTSVRGLAFHPSRAVCAVVHNIARFQVPTTQVEFGWMNVSALSLVSADSEDLLGSVVLDEARRGAANPWSVAWSSDGTQLCITHAGTHELSIISFPVLEERLGRMPRGSLVTDFSFLEGIRKRLALGGKGPRAVVVRGDTAYVAEYFSDTISVVDLSTGSVQDVIALSAAHSADARREGERLFHDATICHQSWQSCSTCHPDGRVDGLNWDLLNDGIGNPKNTKSLLWAHRTPPAMSTGVRASAEEAVRSGLRHILFANRPEAEARAIDEYLKSLRPVPIPYLVKGSLSKAAQRGKRLFEDPKVGCATCHPGPLFTDCKRHDVVGDPLGQGTGIPMDTPTLVECWRTAPYLHDGSAATIREVLTTKNRPDCHGRTSQLSAGQIEDLVSYVLSL
jgi:DNA-binding beta-propeller fold protein YncE